MEKQQLSERDTNTVIVSICTESGCDPKDGEYTLEIIGLIGGLDIGAIGGVDDITLIKDCIANEVDFGKLPEEGVTFCTLEESGEWEDVFWHKYYKLVKVVKHEA